MHAEISCPLAVDVIVCPREQFRPSSTGPLIQRTFPASRHHVWHEGRPLTAADIQRPGRELWILHPHGEALPAALPAAADVQLVLIDGAWREASTLSRQVVSWGRLVNLPMSGESRYWLRSQADSARFSTVEALLFALQHFGLGAQHDALQRQFELHVYAHLRARGHKERAEAFLATSPIASAFPEFIAQLNVRRPR